MPPPVVVPQMRELVRRGVDVLPALIAHLNDQRPTLLVIKREGILMWAMFAAEYDPKSRTGLVGWADPTEAFKANKFPNEYTVKVGDICYALVGQIVNRRLWPVRYQPTGGLIINSPIQSPILVQKIWNDWGNLDSPGHKESLLEDIRHAHRTYEFAPAMVRLKFYYPDAYKSLRGKNLEKRVAFETDNQRYNSPD
jgi:hypothetical protein